MSEYQLTVQLQKIRLQTFVIVENIRQKRTTYTTDTYNACKTLYKAETLQF